MNCFHPLKLPTGYVPCGKCEACLARKRDQWVIRIEQELKVSSSCFFFTLTYDDEHLPRSDVGFPVVSKRDVQLWLKRFRKMIEPYKIRYFIASEYGSTTFRPHYHGIIFNFPLEYDIVSAFNETWQNGFVCVDRVNAARIAYVAKYCISEVALPKYLRAPLYKPFLLSSRKPGIGASFITDDNIDYYCSNLQPFVVCKDGLKKSMPRYYKDKIFDDALKFQLSELNKERLIKEFEEYERKYGKLDSESVTRSALPLRFQYAEQWRKKIREKIVKQSKL